MLKRYSSGKRLYMGSASISSTSLLAWSSILLKADYELVRAGGGGGRSPHSAPFVAPRGLALNFEPGDANICS
jgi:hypothetical protein